MMLEIKDITFAYTDKPVIENISCTIESGQNIALIGRAAAEKHLLKLIYGLYDLNSGAITYNENPF
jgi:ABC-type multidrug transport system fused ATPase/permease subunit